MSTNTIIIECGRIGQDPELKFGKNDSAYLTLSVCTSDSYKGKDGKWVNESNWFDLKFFGQTAEKVAAEAMKGGEVYVRGHVKTETWESENGKRSKQVVIPDFGHVKIYPPRQREEQRAKPQSQRQSADNYEDDDIPW